eukprot:scpid28338/ scgid23356/ Protein bicaudal C homolog 1
MSQVQEQPAGSVNPFAKGDSSGRIQALIPSKQLDLFTSANERPTPEGTGKQDQPESNEYTAASVASPALATAGGPSAGGDRDAQAESASQLPDGHVEEKFRVDRRKLEQMIVSDGRYGETGEQFFNRIMSATSTSIDWPSQLKIGAKSKKDPHVKVRGLKCDAEKARQLVLSMLDTKSNRVTLKIDVSHTEHSHIIGKGGANIKRVMNETGCHIHFPDCNSAVDPRHTQQQEKSNQVTISGQPDSVEVARHQIRELLPVGLTFDINGGQPTSPAHAVAIQSSTLVLNICAKCNVQVQVHVQPRKMVNSLLCEIRSSNGNIANIVAASKELIENLCPPIRYPPVYTQLDIAPQHHLFMIGRNGTNVRRIMERTGAAILFPDGNLAPMQRHSIVTVSGTPDSVISARQILLGRLPLVLLFDVKTDENILRISNDSEGVCRLMEMLDVLISIKPMPPKHRVIIKSIECNAKNVYLARKYMFDDAFMHTLKMPTASAAEAGFSLEGHEWPALSTVSHNLAALSVDNLQQIPKSEGKSEELRKSAKAATHLRRGSLPNVTTSQAARWPNHQAKPSAVQSRLAVSAAGLRGAGNIASGGPDINLLPPILSAGENTATMPPGSAAAASQLAVPVRSRGNRDPSRSGGRQSPLAMDGVPVTDGTTSPPSSSSRPSSAPDCCNMCLSLAGSGDGTYASTADKEWLRPLLDATNTSVGCQELCELLKQIGIEQHYCDIFLHEDIDMTAFIEMNNAELLAIGIDRFGPRKKVMLAIREARGLVARRPSMTSSSSYDESNTSPPVVRSPHAMTTGSVGGGGIPQQDPLQASSTGVVGRYSLSPRHDHCYSKSPATL